MATEIAISANIQAFTQSDLGDAGIPHDLDPYSDRFREVILSMNEEELITFITRDLRNQEDIQYSHGNTVEHKLLFMTAKNTASAVTQEGQPLYSVPSRYPKDSEIVEFREAVSRHLRVEPNKPHVLSEAADLFYNLLMLSKMHPEFDKKEHEQYQAWVEAKTHRNYSDRHKANRYRYMNFFNSMASTLGFSQLDALRLAAIKYHQRLFLSPSKDVVSEEVTLGELEQSFDGNSIVHFPTEDQLINAFDYTIKMEVTLEGYLRAVQDQIKYRKRGYRRKKEVNAVVSG